MARHFFTTEATIVTPDANPQTLCQILAPTLQGVFLAFVDMQLLGASGATAPIPFDMVTQTNDPGSNTALTMIKTAPEPSVAIQTSGFHLLTGSEPAGTTDIKDSFALHQQGHQTWIPTGKGIFIPANTRLGIRYKSATFVALILRLHLEE